MTLMSPTAPPAPSPPGTGGRLVTVDGRTLPLRGAALEAEARGGLARVVLRQRFANPGDEPLRATYQVPLPADAAVGGYVFVVGDRRIVGEIDRREAARERYEQALVEGRSAALLEQERTSVFTQEIGNIPPGAEVACELHLDQRLRWRADGRWEWRFPTVIGPRYMGAGGRVPDREAVSVDVADAPLDVRAELSLAIRDALAGGPPESGSHPIRVDTGDGRVSVTFADETGARLDRDVVVCWPVAAGGPGATIDVARPSADRNIADAACGLLTLVPPRPDRRGPCVPRDLVVLTDTSGSMHGRTGSRCSSSRCGRGPGSGRPAR